MAPSLHDALESALGYLPAALGEPFTGHPLGHLLVRDAPDALRDLIPDPGYKLQGSIGRGRWAETVWVSVFDRLVTSSARRGYYIVYLLRRDGSGLYLSLDQAATAVLQEVGGRRYLGVLRDRGTLYVGLLKEQDLEGLQRGPIDLGGQINPPDPWVRGRQHRGPLLRGGRDTGGFGARGRPPSLSRPLPAPHRGKQSPRGR